MPTKPKIYPSYVTGDLDHPWGGINTTVKDNRYLDRGEAYDQLNWITGRDKDHIELRRGSITLGSIKRNIATAKIQGLGIGIKNDGTQVPFFKFQRKILYYDITTNTTIEIGTDILPATAIDDDFNFMPYQNLAGSYIYGTSKNSSIYKFSVANLGSYVDLGTSNFHFGFAKINRGYMFGMNRKGSSPNSQDTTGLWLSTPDSIANNSTQLTFSAGTGDGTTKTFSGTIVLVAPNTAYFVSITDTNETFTDDKNGNLIGSLGGIGTINYITGAYSVTFNTAPANAQAISGTYYEEDSVVNGVADFTGTGSDSFRQDDGGGTAQSVWPFQGVEYCFHQLRSWLLTITIADATTFDNEPYYEQIGIPNIRGAYPTGDGILFLNNALPAQPKFSILEIPPGSTNLTVAPTSLSDALDLSQYGINDVVVFRWGDFDFLSVKDTINGMTQNFNGVTLIRNIVSGLWNKLDFFINCGVDFAGTLLAGSSLSANVFELFSGFDDSNTAIPNFHNQAFTNFGMEGLKKCSYLNMSGLIQKGQNLDVFISLDNGDYIKVFTIAGDGPYVSSQSLVTIGSQGVGVNTVGGGFDGQTEYASRYEVDIPILQYCGLFEYIGWRIQATGVGYVSVERQEWKDIRFKRRRLLSYEDSQIDN